MGALKVAASRPGRPVQEGSTAGDGALPPLPGWLWPLCWVVLAVAVGLLVRLPGPATLDPDEHAAVHYFDSLVAGERLEEPLLSSPKPLLTVVHGLAWRAGHDWRLLEALAVAAFALAVVCLARSAGRLAGPPAAAATALAVAGSGPLVLQAARGNSMVFALAAWSVALDALTTGPGSRGAGSRGGRPSGGGAAWGVAAAALFVAGLARAESWLLLPLAAGYGIVAWRRSERRAALLVLPLAAPLAWLAHDWLLTGDPLYALGVPGRYSDLVSGRHVVPPGDWLALVARRYADPLLLALAAVGVIWLFRRRAWVWLAALGAAGVGVLILLGLQAWQGTYISWRYFDPADVALRVAAALGAAAVAGLVAGRLPGRTATGGGGAATTADPAPAGDPSQSGLWPRALGAVVGAVVLVGLACWPLAPGDPLVDSTLDRDTRLSANTATAVAVLAQVTAEPGTVVTVSGPQRLRVAVELGLPLDRVRDLFLAGRSAPLHRALAGSAAVFHDADGDRPVKRFAPLSTTVSSRVGEVELVPLRTDPERGLYVHRVAGSGE
ncbi:MAG TPA: hypothetical protein VFW32_07645 [Actinomycetes bacterium]|nr:hypothetical protein [Actinomycetes bacterium]